MSGRYVQRRGVFQRAIAEGQNQSSYWGPQYGRVPVAPVYQQVPQAFAYNPLDFDQLSTGMPIRRANVAGTAIGSMQTTTSASAKNLMNLYSDELYGRGNGIFEGRTVSCSSSPAEQQVQRGGIFDAATFAEDCVYDGEVRGRRIDVQLGAKRRYLENDAMKAKRIGFSRQAVSGPDGLWSR